MMLGEILRIFLKERMEEEEGELPPGGRAEQALGKKKKKEK